VYHVPQIVSITGVPSAQIWNLLCRGERIRGRTKLHILRAIANW